MTNLEILAKKIFDECAKDGEPVTMDEALEMATFEIKSKDVDTTVQSDKKVKRERIRKVDVEKQTILKEMTILLGDMGAEDIATKTETELSFSLMGSNYTIRLIKHRERKDR